MIKILELFGGIGSPRCALRNIGIPVKAKYLRKAREAAEGTPEPTKKKRRR